MVSSDEHPKKTIEVLGKRMAYVEMGEGDPIVFLDVHETCNACWYCLVAKASTRCPSRKVYGITYCANEA